jgi:hypothetical protein
LRNDLAEIEHDQPLHHREQRVHHSLLHVFVFLLGLGLMVGLTALE